MRGRTSSSAMHDIRGESSQYAAQKGKEGLPEDIPGPHVRQGQAYRLSVLMELSGRRTCREVMMSTRCWISPDPVPGEWHRARAVPSLSVPCLSLVINII